MSIQRATFVSVWNNGEYRFGSDCEIDLENNTFGNVETVDHMPDEMESLDEEFIEDSSGKIHYVCMNCHEKFTNSGDADDFCNDCNTETYEGI
jgi:hypothetical protein